MALTIGNLIAGYTADRDFARLSYKVRLNYGRYLARIDREYGAKPVSDIKSNTLQRWHKKWVDGHKLASGKAFVGQLRALFRYGIIELEDPHCIRLVSALDKLRFETTPARTSRMNGSQAGALRLTARKVGYFSVALAQAFQYELLMRQKDVIGEWLPLSESNGRDARIQNDGEFWDTGLRWEEIDQNWILCHKTNSREGTIRVDLRRARMVMEELSFYNSSSGDAAVIERNDFPSFGPIIVCEYTARPWIASAFRRNWRKLAAFAGLPTNLKNLDSRAGAKMEKVGGRYYQAFERRRPGELLPK